MVGINPDHPLAMTEERFERLQQQLYFKIEDVVNRQVPSKRGRMAADLDAITSLAAATAAAPIMHTLHSAAASGFAQAGMHLPKGAVIPETPVTPTEKN